MKRCTMYDVRCTIVSLLLMFSVSAFAQSNLTYELKVGTTGENTLLKEFPESYSGEKVNIKIIVESQKSKAPSNWTSCLRMGISQTWLMRLTASIVIRMRRRRRGPYGGAIRRSRTAVSGCWWVTRIRRLKNTYVHIQRLRE